MADIEDFGLKPKQDCQVDCPVLKKLYDSFRREADSLWGQVDEDNGQSSPKALAYLRTRAATFSNVCTSLAMVFNPRVTAVMLESMMVGEDEEESPEEGEAMQLYYCYDDLPDGEGDVIIYISDLPDRVNDDTSDALQRAVDTVLDSSGVEVDRWIMENAHMVRSG